MNYACKPSVRHLLENSCPDVILPRANDKEKQVWDDDQANRFIRYCQASLLRNAVMFMLLLKTGLRIGEAFALRWTDVDLEAGLLYVTRTAYKGGGYGPPKSKRSQRKVPFDQGLVRLLYQAYCFKSFRYYCEQAKVPHIMPHGLRHTHATFLLRNRSFRKRCGGAPGG